MTKTEEMTESVIKHVSKKEYFHKKWLERQTAFKKIREQDCYGYKRNSDKSRVRPAEDSVGVG